MSAPATTTLKEVAEATQKNSAALETVTKTLGDVVTKLKSMPAPGTPSKDAVLGAPWARHGEDAMSSRGFSFMKMLGVLTGAIGPEHAKIETDIHARLHKCYAGDLGKDGYEYAGRGLKFLAPLATSYMHEDVVPTNFRREMKGLVTHGVGGADQDEMAWIRRQQYKALGYGQKDMSWLSELRGGALVAPPEMGELIELLRNKEALVNAGARTVPLPPQGRMKYPRQTTASLTYWVGENLPITASDIGTGEVTLQAKKLAVMIKAPNELIRFASPAAEALMRDDMTKSLALGLDLAGLEGLGGDTRPLGVIYQNGIQTVSSSSQGADGDALVGKDIYRMVAAVEEANAEFEGWIMRPKTLYRYYQLRADAVAQGDGQGVWLFNLIREAGDGVKPMLAGYPVTKSTQVSGTQTKGAGTNLTYILGGMWSDMLIGMFGAIEFAATTMGDTAFTNDQTWVRGILSADIALRHPAAFVYCPQLNVNG
ncbi:MAG: phage major capsid protein [Phycisphaerales bacterium]|nr:phage major capsid protein [Phycisphaerales bacterium]